MSDIIPIEEKGVDEFVETKMLTEKLLKDMQKLLSEREFKIIVMRYGLNNQPALTQLEVATKLGISRSYISRIETKAINVIKDYMKEKDLYID